VSDQSETEARPPKSYAYYAFLILVYQALYGAFVVAYRRKGDSLERLSALDMTMLGLATLRIAKTISEDEITTVLRRPLIEVGPNGKRPRGHGLRWALGKLVLCPTCTGTWVAAFLTYALHLFPRTTRPLLAIMSASGAEQLSDAMLSLIYTDRDLLRKQEERHP